MSTLSCLGETFIWYAHREIGQAAQEVQLSNRLADNLALLPTCKWAEIIPSVTSERSHFPSPFLPQKWALPGEFSTV